jgi:hypothetical protein
MSSFASPLEQSVAAEESFTAIRNFTPVQAEALS